MAQRPWNPILEHIRSLAARGDSSTCDAELLRQFVSHRDESAFESLLRRHGPMVLRVARRSVGNDAEAEDVFQATFLLLARRAATIRKRESVASWLHGVAHRLALSARAKGIRQQQREREAATMRLIASPPESVWTEWEEMLHEVLAQLPAKYRTPLVYCYLEGRTQEEVARQLGKPLGTVRSWLARGRELLRKRLLRRGISLSTEGASAALLASACATAEAVPPALRMTTLQAIHLFAAGGNAMTMLSPTVAGLVQKGMSALLIAKLKSGAVWVLVLALLVTGSGWAAHRTFSAKPPDANETTEKTEPKQAASEERPRTDVFGDPLPPGAVARLGTVRFRHEGGIFQLAVSPDGRTLAAAAGKSVVLWDSQTGRLTGRVAFKHDVHCVAFAPDGKSVAAGTMDCIVHQVDPTSGKELQRFVGHRAFQFGESWRNSIHGVAFSADGQRLVTWGSDETARLWDVHSGKELRTLDVKGWRTVQGGMYYLYFDVATNGKLVAAATQEAPKILQLRDAATGKVVRQLIHPADVDQAAFSPDGKTVAVPCGTLGQPGRIVLWDLSNGKELGTLAGHKDVVSELAFSPDGKKLASCGYDATIRLWDVDSRKELRQALALDSMDHRLAFSRDGKTLFSSGDNHVRLWDVAAWRERRMLLGPRTGVKAVVFSPDVTRAASATGKTIWLWNTATGERIRSLEGHEADIAGLAFSTDGTTLISASEGPYSRRRPCKDRSIRVWDLKTGQEKRRMANQENRIDLIALTPDRATLAVWGSDKHDRVLVRNMRTDAKLRTFAVPPDGSSGENRLTAFRFSPDGKILYASGYLDILRWDVATGKSLPSLSPHDGEVEKIDLSHDGRSLAALTNQGTLYLWEIASKQTRLVEKSAGYATSIAFSPDGHLLALTNTGYHQDHDGNSQGIENREQVRLVRVADAKIVHRFTGHIGGINGVSFSADGRTLASASQDTTVLLWDVAKMRKEAVKETVSLKREKLAELWKGLRGTAAEAHGCMWKLIAAPGQAVLFFSEKLKPVASVDAERFARLLRKLDSDQFAQREEATQELKKLGDAIEPPLRKAIQDKPTLETRRRLQSLLDDLEGPERLRSLRAIEVLERIGDKPARDLLRRLSGGAADARLTEEARATLRRLK